MRNCAHCGTAVQNEKHCDDCSYTKSPWRLDNDALLRACDELGILLPVRVAQVSDRDDPIGLYHAPRRDSVDGGLFHPISVVARLTAPAASRSIWHEMTHAAQWESDPDFIDNYNRLNEAAQNVAKQNGLDYKEIYRLIPYEVEAKANEAYHDSMFPLALPNKRASMRTIRDHHRIVSVKNGVIVKGYAAEEIERRNRGRIERARKMLNR